MSAYKQITTTIALVIYLLTNSMAYATQFQSELKRTEAEWSDFDRVDEQFSHTVPAKLSRAIQARPSE